MKLGGGGGGCGAGSGARAVTQMMVILSSSYNYFVIFRIWTVSFVKMCMPLSSQRFQMDIRDPVFNSSKMKACCIFSESTLNKGTFSWLYECMTPHW